MVSKASYPVTSGYVPDRLSRLQFIPAQAGNINRSKVSDQNIKIQIKRLLHYLCCDQYLTLAIFHIKSVCRGIAPNQFPHPTSALW